VKIFIVIFCCAFFAGIFTAATVSGIQEYCDPNLSPPAGHPYKYSYRDNRCEGIYIQEVANTPLQVVSLTESFENYDLNLEQGLLVEWTPFSDRSVQLRAQGLRRRLYYRMDTIRVGNTGAFRWPSVLLSVLNIPQKQLGVIAWVNTTVGQIERNVYLPLRISQQQQPHLSRHYTMVLLPARDLNELFISLATVGPDGQPAKFLTDGKSQGHGRYPAQWPIAIHIPYPSTKGFYYIEIGATLSGGGVSTTELWFFHSHM
jgi:hypothetical protein